MVGKESINKEIDKLQNIGYSNYYIGKHLNVSEDYIKQYTSHKFGTNSSTYNAEIHPDHNLINKQANLCYKLYKEDGMSIEEISEMMGYVNLYTTALINRFMDRNIDDIEFTLAEPINVYRLEVFKNKHVHIGDVFTVKNRYTYLNDDIDLNPDIDVTILQKYPFIVVTDKGCYQYYDLFIGKKKSK